MNYRRSSSVDCLGGCECYLILKYSKIFKRTEVCVILTYEAVRHEGISSDFAIYNEFSLLVSGTSAAPVCKGLRLS